MRTLWFACVACGLLLSLACGGAAPDDHGCATKYDCPAGQTCWSLDGQTWSCMTSGPGGHGAKCAAVGGAPQCGDQLACVAYGGPDNGTCQYWCDSIPCPAGAGSCVTHPTTNTFSMSTCM